MVCRATLMHNLYKTVHVIEKLHRPFTNVEKIYENEKVQFHKDF